ncbi:7081_t:CDS:1 [Funneliformis geosporum]|uniref:13306_t:CDS:1 n=1 Tax=Funneliformis geosporum TaxID=1117311 RepID=A0A9W4WHT8_9GLOM|nr:7081_t:CDS:1 [Funneliformis geosporum]CAI2162786.1 13306_t:CDS:1 [Funneliformis geosporum]
MSAEENFHDNVNRLFRMIDVAELFNVGNIVIALKNIKNPRDHKPCVALTNLRLFNVVFGNVISNYPEIDESVKNELKYVGSKIWDESTSQQKNIYQTYCKQHNDEIIEIFPENTRGNSRSLKEQQQSITPGGVDPAQITATPSPQSTWINGDHLSSSEDFPIVSDVQVFTEMVFPGTGLT